MEFVAGGIVTDTIDRQYLRVNSGEFYITKKQSKYFKYLVRGKKNYKKTLTLKQFLKRSK